MNDDIITIFYTDDESGPAQYLGNRLARIIDPPLLTDEVFVDDIVRLCHDPDEDDGYPCIEEVVHSRFSCRTRLEYDDEHELSVLTAMFSIVGAECYSLIPPGNRRGIAIVGHCEHIDPEMLAEAIGIPQMVEDDCGDAEEEVSVAR